MSGNCNASAERGQQSALRQSRLRGLRERRRVRRPTPSTAPMHICLGRRPVRGRRLPRHLHRVHGNGADLRHHHRARLRLRAGPPVTPPARRTRRPTAAATSALNGACVAGDCHDTSIDCTAGKICSVSTHTCGNCSAGSAGDTQCTSDPPATRATSASRACAASATATPPAPTAAEATRASSAASARPTPAAAAPAIQPVHADSFYGPNFICNYCATGKCVTRACGNNNMACTANDERLLLRRQLHDRQLLRRRRLRRLGTACVNHTCSTCNGVTGNKWYVDPVSGNDSTANRQRPVGGNGGAGLRVQDHHARRHRRRVDAGRHPDRHRGHRLDATGLVAGDTHPITVPSNTTLTTTGGPITITVRPRGPAVPVLNNNSGVSAITRRRRSRSTATTTTPAPPSRCRRAPPLTTSASRT